MKGLMRLGIYKMWITRLQTYLALIQFAMLLYLYIIEEPLGVQWYYWIIVVILFSITTLIVDIKYVFPGSQAYGFIKNPRWIEMEQKIEHIIEILEEKT